MNDVDYSKRELDYHFTEIKDALGRQDKVLSEIREQTTKTNGRVSALENWKQWATGVTLAIWLGVVPLVIYIFNLDK